MAVQDARARMKARVQALLDAGHSPDDIRGMKDQLLSEVRDSLGPTPAPAVPPSIAGTRNDYAGPQPQEPGVTSDEISMSPLDALLGGAKFAAKKVGQAKDAAGKAVLDAVAPGATKQFGGLHDRLAANPDTAGLADIQDFQGEVPGMVGSMLVGGALGKGASAALGAETAGTGLGAAASRMGANAIGGGLGAAGGQVATDVATGNPEGLEGRARGAGTSGALLSGLMSGIGEIGQAGGNAVVNSKGGKARQLIESENGNVGPFSSGDQGPFAPGGRLAGRKPNSRDIGTVSRESAVNILNRTEADKATALASPLGEKAALDAENKGHVVVNDLVSEMQKLSTNKRLTIGERSTVKQWLSDMDEHMVHVDGEPTGVYAMTPKDLNDTRGMLQDSTGVGDTPGTVAKGKMQGIAAAAKKLVDETGYAGPNKAIHEANNQYEGARRLLRLPDSPAGGAKTPEGLPRGEVERVTQMMARQGQNTTTAGGQNASVGDESPVPGQARENLDQLAEQFPQHKTDVRMPQVLDAKGDLQYRLLPRTDSGGLMEKLKSGAPAALAGLAAGGGSGVAAGHPLLSTLLGLSTMGAVNSAPAIAGRLLYTPARLAAAAGRGLSGAAAETGAGLGGLDPLQALLDSMEEKKKAKGRK